MHGKARMLELTIYGLMGLAAMLVMAFFVAYGNEFAPDRETSSSDLISNTHLHGSQMIEAGTGNPQFRGTVGKQPETATASLLHQQPAETGPGALYSDSFQSDRGQVEIFHG
jgi:hypothetical protein